MKTLKLVKILSVGALSAMLLAACGDNSEVTTKEKDSDKTEEVAEKEKTEEKKEESKVGTRSNPVKINEIATVDTVIYDDDSNSFGAKIDLEVTEVIRGEEAYAKLKEMNEFNEAAPEGYEWILAKVKVKVAESETEDHPFTIDGVFNFKFVSEGGDVYSGDIYGTTEPDFYFEMYNGNEKEGYIPRLVKTGENAQLQYEDWANANVFFNLQ